MHEYYSENKAEIVVSPVNEVCQHGCHITCYLNCFLVAPMAPNTNIVDAHGRRCCCQSSLHCCMAF